MNAPSMEVFKIGWGLYQDWMGLVPTWSGGRCLEGGLEQDDLKVSSNTNNSINLNMSL